jgi:hypothetical protein
MLPIREDGRHIVRAMRQMERRDVPGLDGAWSAVARPGRTQAGESGASPTKVESDFPIASLRNGRIVEQGKRKQI